MRLDKIMIVGSKIPQPLNKVLCSTTSKVTHVRDGNRAVARAQHEMFDAAILISTGEEMDLAETVFNLSDISASMELIILSDHTNMVNSAIPKETIAGLVSSATVMTIPELEKHLNWL